MSDEERSHDAVMAAGSTTMAMMDALKDPEVIESLDAIHRWTQITVNRLSAHDVNEQNAASWIVGVVLAGIWSDKEVDE